MCALAGAWHNGVPQVCSCLAAPIYLQKGPDFFLIHCFSDKMLQGQPRL